MNTKTIQPLQVSIYSNDSSFCSGTTTLLVAQACGGTKPIKYQWNNGSTNDTILVTPTTTTTYTVTVKDTDGQTATDAVIVMVSQPTSSTIAASIIQGGSYSFNGTTYTKAGTYITVLTNVKGCDSTTTLVLGVIDSSSCTGSLGETFINETFGSGTNYGPKLADGSTSNLLYSQKNCPGDGYYAITNYTSGCWPLPDVAWNTMTDHTGDENGYFMLVNASYAASDFFIKKVTGLCEGTTYKFSSWIMNVCTNGGNKPNITFTIEKNDGTILASYKSGDIPSSRQPQWKEYYLYFKTPAGVSDVVLRMRNNARGGVGNDLALDDITFRPVGPNITLSVQGTSSDSITTCQGDDSLVLQASVETCYDSTAYQWQCSTDMGVSWNDIDGAKEQSYTAAANVTGHYLYRLAVAQAGNISDGHCRVTSSPVRISVYPRVYSIIDTSICKGESLLGHTTTGTYVDTLVSSTGCDSIITLYLTVNQPTSSTIMATICEGDSYPFNGINYTSSGTYSVHLINKAGCDSTATLVLTIDSSKTPSIIIQTNSTALCEGTLATFTAITTNEGINPTYQWKVNGINVGTNSNNYSSATLHDKDVVICTMVNNIGGCTLANSTDTVFITVKKSSSNTISQNLCGSFTLNGQTYTTSGIYTQTLINTVGCDSIITLNLTINQPTKATITQSICQGGNYIFDGINYATAGTYTIQKTNAAGCDSIITLNLIPMFKIIGDSLICENTLHKPYNIYTKDTISTFIWKVTGNRKIYAPNSKKLNTYRQIDWVAPGIDTITVSADNGICKASDQLIVKVAPHTKPNYSWNRIDNIVNFKNETKQAIISEGSLTEIVPFDYFTWDFGVDEGKLKFQSYTSYLNDSILTNKYTNGYYPVELKSYNKYCIDSTIKEIFITNDKALYVPNAFYPESSSPELAIFKPKGFNLKTYTLSIYDIWGNLIWYSDKLHNGAPAEGWNGIYTGETVKMDCYIWKIEATFLDGTTWEGQSLINNTKKSTFGNVILVR